MYATSVYDVLLVYFKSIAIHTHPELMHGGRD